MSEIDPFRQAASDAVIAAVGMDEARKFEAELRRGEHARHTLYKAQQRRIAEAGKRLGPRKTVDGIGRHRLRVTAEAYHYWGARLGYGCWGDKQFLDEFERDNPECRVETVMKPMILRP